MSKQKISKWGKEGGGGVATQKTEKKQSHIEICGSVPFFFGIFWVFSVFFGIFRYSSVFCGTVSVFFGLNFDNKFQPFKNHVNNEILGGQERPNNKLNA